MLDGVNVIKNPSPDLVCWFVEDSSFLMVGYGCMGIFSSTFIAFSSSLPFPIRYIYIMPFIYQRIYILFLNKPNNLKNTLGYILYTFQKCFGSPFGILYIHSYPIEVMDCLYRRDIGHVLDAC